MFACTFKTAILLYFYFENDGAYILSDIPNFFNYFINNLSNIL